MRLQNIVRLYEKISIDEVVFNENSYELEVDLWDCGYKNHQNFVKDCNLIKKRLEEKGYECAKDEEYSEYIYKLYIII